MANTKQAFLEGITKENFTNWVHNDAFIAYASSTGKNGLVELGVDGKGKYAIKFRHKSGIYTYSYENASNAVKAFKKFLA